MWDNTTFYAERPGQTAQTHPMLPTADTSLDRGLEHREDACARGGRPPDTVLVQATGAVRVQLFTYLAHAPRMNNGLRLLLFQDPLAVVRRGFHGCVHHHRQNYVEHHHADADEDKGDEDECGGLLLTHMAQRARRNGQLS